MVPKDCWETTMSVNVPPGFKTGFLSEVVAKGIARIHIIKDGEPIGFIDADGPSLGHAAALLLSVAQAISPYDGAHGEIPPSSLHGDLTKVTVPISRIALSTNPKPAFETLGLQVGEAALGFEFPTESLRELGEAFLAASARRSIAAH
jgi:hypothetical protein